MRVNIYFTEKGKTKADKLASILGLPLSRLFNFLVEYYVRKEKINLDTDKTEVL